MSYRRQLCLQLRQSHEGAQGFSNKFELFWAQAVSLSSTFWGRCYKATFYPQDCLSFDPCQQHAIFLTYTLDIILQTVHPYCQNQQRSGTDFHHVHDWSDMTVPCLTDHLTLKNSNSLPLILTYFCRLYYGKRKKHFQLENYSLAIWSV